MENTKKKGPLSNLSVDDALRRIVKGLESDSDDDNTDDDFFLSSDEEESLDALSDAESDVEQDADSDDHAAVRVLERDGEFTLPRASRSGRGRAANRLGRQLAGRRGAPGAARVARAANRGVLRGVARGGRRCRGRGRGVQPAPGGEYKTWEEEDDHVPPVFEFEPQREAGFHFPEDFAPVCEMDFFELFFSDEVIQTIAEHTNDYADMHILGKLTYAQPDGSWHPTSSEEIRKFIAFLLYMGLVRVGSYELYWSTASLYYGLWGRAFFTRLRFKALLAFLHVDVPDNDPADRLHKVRFVYDKVRTASAQLWQPKQHVSLDERMIRFKGRHSMKVYVKNKPVKWGFKTYALCDSSNHYNYAFEMYCGQVDVVSEHGLTYDVVMRLFSALLNQGYCLYTDNYYTSNVLATTSLANSSHLTGTVRSNRTGFPDALKNVKAFQRAGNRGDIRYVNANDVLYVQWLDKRVVTVLSTQHQATTHDDTSRRVKVDGAWGWKSQLAGQKQSVITTVSWAVWMPLTSSLLLTACSVAPRSHGSACFTTWWRWLRSTRTSSCRNTGRSFQMPCHDELHTHSLSTEQILPANLPV